MTPLYLGLDAGGSTTTLLAVAGDRRLTLTGPASNAQRYGLATSSQVLADLIRNATARFPEAEVQAACAGVAGASNIEVQQALAKAVRQRLGAEAPDHLHICHDADIALEGAFEGGSGLIVIAGTGSVLFARDADGQRHRVGGWGYLLGDDGSGYAIGLHGLRAIAYALDGGPFTQLQALLAERHDLRTRDALIERTYGEAWPAQDAAPLVCEAAAGQDVVALDILTTQAEALAQQAGWLVNHHGGIAPRVALFGGLTRNVLYREILGRALRAELPGWTLQPPSLSPVEGALRFAIKAAMQ